MNENNYNQKGCIKIKCPLLSLSRGKFACHDDDGGGGENAGRKENSDNKDGEGDVGRGHGDSDVGTTCRTICDDDHYTDILKIRCEQVWERARWRWLPNSAVNKNNPLTPDNSYSLVVQCLRIPNNRDSVIRKGCNIPNATCELDLPPKASLVRYFGQNISTVFIGRFHS